MARTAAEGPDRGSASGERSTTARLPAPPRGQGPTGSRALRPLDAAFAYLARGWSVIPLRPRDKRPLLPWEPFQHRAATVAELTAWRARWPEANLGVVTGAISGLVVLDVDPAKGGLSSLAAVEATFGPLPATVRVRTGGGGLHLCFRHPGHPVACAVALRPGLDVRGDGGYVVAPPSIHPSGRPYIFEPGGPREPAPLPGWLAQLLHEGRVRAPHPRSWWRRLLREGLVEGERNTRLAQLAGLLLHHRVDPGIVLELLQGWNLGRCRPPLPPEEVARIVASIRRTRERAERIRAEETAAAAPAGSAAGDPATGPAVASPAHGV